METRSSTLTKQFNNMTILRLQVLARINVRFKCSKVFLALAVGTIAFSMQDVILEPYGGEILAMSVGETTLQQLFLPRGHFWHLV